VAAAPTGLLWLAVCAALFVAARLPLVAFNAACRLGEAVQVDPIKPALKSPGTKCVGTKV